MELGLVKDGCVVDSTNEQQLSVAEALSAGLVRIEPVGGSPVDGVAGSRPAEAGGNISLKKSSSPSQRPNRRRTAQHDGSNRSEEMTMDRDHMDKQLDTVSEAMISEKICILEAFYYKHKGLNVEGRITDQMLRSGEVDLSRGSVLDPVTLKHISIVRAIKTGGVFATVITLVKDGRMYLECFQRRRESYLVQSVYSASRNRLVGVKDALNDGILNIRRGTYLNRLTGDVSALNEALSQGLIQAEVLPRLVPLEERPFDHVHVRTIEEDMSLAVPTPPPHPLKMGEAAKIDRTDVATMSNAHPLTRDTAVSPTHLDELGAIPTSYLVRPGYEVTPDGDIVHLSSGQRLPLQQAMDLGVVSRGQRQTSGQVSLSAATAHCVNGAHIINNERVDLLFRKMQVDMLYLYILWQSVGVVRCDWIRVPFTGFYSTSSVDKVKRFCGCLLVDCCVVCVCVCVFHCVFICEFHWC